MYDVILLILGVIIGVVVMKWRSTTPKKVSPRLAMLLSRVYGSSPEEFRVAFDRAMQEAQDRRKAKEDARQQKRQAVGESS